MRAQEKNKAKDNLATLDNVIRETFSNIKKLVSI